MKHIPHRHTLINCNLIAAWLDEDTGKVYVQRKRLPMDAATTAKEWAAVLKTAIEKNPNNVLGNAYERMMYRHNWTCTRAWNSLKRHAGVDNVIHIYTGY